MFCIKSDVMTLESIEMYGFVTTWMSMDDGPYWVILLMYESHEMRHTVGVSQNNFEKHKEYHFGVFLIYFVSFEFSIYIFSNVFSYSPLLVYHY